MAGEATFLNHPEASRLFVQEGSGKPWVWVGCVSARNIQINPRQLEFTRCITENGIETTSIPRIPNPTQFDVTFRANWSKWQSLHQGIIRQGCLPNMFFAMAQCRDADKVQDPTYNSNGLILYGVDLATPYQFGSNGIIVADPNQAVAREDQMGFTHSTSAWVRDYTYGLQAVCQNGVSASPIPADSMAIIDIGECAEFICRACDVTGCQQILINNGVDFYYSYDGGATWIQVLGSGVGRAQAFNGNAFAVKVDDIRMYAGLDANASVWANWTQAIVEAGSAAFAGLSQVVQIDPRTLVVGGTNGGIWRSRNGGSNWTNIRIAVPVTASYYSFHAMVWNPTLKQLVGVGSNAANEVFIQVSTDKGKTWTDVGVKLAGKAWAGSSEAMLLAAGQITFAVVDGDLYRIECADGLTAYEKLAITGASGDIVGIGSLDPVNGNQIFLAVDDGVDGSIVKTIDGFYTWSTEALTFPITGGQTVVPTGVCENKYGKSLWYAFGNNIYYGRDWESFFLSD